MAYGQGTGLVPRWSTSLHTLARRLEDHGVEVTWDDNFPGFHRFYASDKLGNRLEFLERRTNP
ncbi:hypothetical protein [Streptomyces sp. HJ7]